MSRPVSCSVAAGLVEIIIRLHGSNENHGYICVGSKVKWRLILETAGQIQNSKEVSESNNLSFIFHYRKLFMVVVHYWIHYIFSFWVNKVISNTPSNFFYLKSVCYCCKHMEYMYDVNTTCMFYLVDLYGIMIQYSGRFSSLRTTTEERGGGVFSFLVCCHCLLTIHYPAY